MIERIDDPPENTIGLRASGKLSREDYTEVLEPALQDAVATGHARVLFLLHDFDGLERGAWIEDVKTGLKTEIQNRDAWHRFALVTDVEWIAKAIGAFSWLMPGELEVYGLDALDDAREWVAA